MRGQLSMVVLGLLATSCVFAADPTRQIDFSAEAKDAFTGVLNLRIEEMGFETEFLDYESFYLAGIDLCEEAIESERSPQEVLEESLETYVQELSAVLAQIPEAEQLRFLSILEPAATSADNYLCPLA